MLTLFVISMLLVVTCSPVAEGGDAPPKMINEVLRKDSSALIIDVRTPEEYAQGHIKNSRLMNYYDAEFHTQLQTLPKERRIVLYCRSGRRSGDAMTYLTSIGYSRVFNLQGGIIAWKRDGLPLVIP